MMLPQCWAALVKFISIGGVNLALISLIKRAQNLAAFMDDLAEAWPPERAEAFPYARWNFSAAKISNSTSDENLAAKWTLSITRNRCGNRDDIVTRLSQRFLCHSWFMRFS
jgi:hypothetical protein